MRGSFFLQAQCVLFAIPHSGRHFIHTHEFFFASPATKGGKFEGAKKWSLTIRHWIISAVSNAFQASFVTKIIAHVIY